MKRCKINKSCGPDKIGARVLKLCASQLSAPLQTLFQASLDQSIVPDSWKLSEIVPVPKVRFPVEKNDTRPVCLTSLIMKCLEHIVKKYICINADEIMDNLQFAYRKGRSAQDATLTVLHQITEHLEETNSHVRVLYIDFSNPWVQVPDA